MNPRLRISFVFCLIAVSLLPAACRKYDKSDTDPSLRLQFSSDTLFFDTVFTTVGSVTQRLLVYNPHKSAVTLASVTLAGGAASMYRINVDGDSSLSVPDVRIDAEDSLYVFVRITIDPTNQQLPFLVADSLLFSLNGNIQQVQLAAWGQNARFYKSAILEGNQVWDSLLPHVIYGHVRIDTGGSLMILPGTRVYFHKDAYLALSQGTTITGTGNVDHPIRFQGDRLDPFYRDLTGQWLGIIFEEGSGPHELEHAIIRNGIYGIVLLEPVSGVSPMLRLSNTEIRNMTSDAIYAEGTSIESVNCVVSNCGGAAVRIEKGGSYSFLQLSVGNYWSGSVRTSPALMISNYTYDSTGNQIPGPLINTLFANTILYGSAEEEVVLDQLDGVAFDILFDHCLLKTTTPISDPSRYVNCLANEDPMFVDPAAYNLRPDSLSPVIGIGKNLGIPFDIDGNPRGDHPDLGAYQWVPTR